MLHYEFSLMGRTYSGTRQSLDDVGIIKSVEVAQREADALPAGRSVQIFYDPKDPSKSLLKPGVPVSGLPGSLFGALLVAGGLALVAIGHICTRTMPRGAGNGRPNLKISGGQEQSALTRRLWPQPLDLDARHLVDDELHRLEAQCCGRNDGNEDKRFLTGVKNTVDFPAMGYQHISLGDGNRLSISTKAVLAATREDGPCILAIRMHMSRDLLAGLDSPSNDRCVSRLGDD